MKYNFIFSIFLIGTIVISCSELSIEETANIPSSTAPTIIAFLCPQDTVHTVELSYTWPAIGASRQQEWVENVNRSIVTLSIDAKTVVLQPDKIQNHKFTISAKDFKVEEGKTYTLNVTTNDGQKAKATCVIPNYKVDFSNVETKLISIDINQNKKYAVVWTDIANEINYYSIQVFNKIISRTTVSAGFRESEFGILDKGYENGRLISKKSFIMAPRKSSPTSYTETEIEILNTDIHFYRYHQDLESIDTNNPFVEPFNLYSNVKGGFGIFAGYTRASGIFVE
ncbi:MAG: DUF4249 domain-containing protein [Cyclobacteriaceae bacterium]|nr:DUF4249 domain-containing protein [Cyclobacteriaceae bacterium]